MAYRSGARASRWTLAARHRHWLGARDTRETRDAITLTHQRRGNPVTLLVTETTGVLSSTFDRALHALAKDARAPTTHDSTRYGLLPRFFSPDLPVAHHRAAIVLADAMTILLATPAMSFKLAMGLPPF